jgi:transposase
LRKLRYTKEGIRARKADTRLIVDTDDLAELFNVHPSTVRRWISSGKLLSARTTTENLKQLISACIDKGIV